MGILDKILGRNKAPTGESTGQPSPLGKVAGEKEPKAAQEGGGEEVGRGGSVLGYDTSQRTVT